MHKMLFGQNELITITQYGDPTYIKGRAVQGVSISNSGLASIQPLNGKEILQLAEGDREKESIKVFTDQVALINNADLIRASGDIFELQGVKNWMDHTIPHYRGVGVKRE